MDRTSSIRARKGTTCSNCRQMKLRCDAAKRFPAPCSRCARTGKSCSRLGSNGRHTRRDQVVGDESMSQADERRPSVVAQTIPMSQTLTEFEEGLSETPAVIETEILEDLECDPQLFNEFMDDFWDHFHPRMPFFISKESLRKDCASCSLLFWAVVAVAARRQDRHSDFYLALTWPIRRLAMEQSITVLPTVPLIQALLLLCLWPLPFGAMIDDPSAVLCGIATQKAMQIGLHRPFRPSDYVWGLKAEPTVVRSRARTWAICFIVNKSISGTHGIPMLVRPDHALLTLQKQGSDDVDPVLRDLVHLSHRQYSITQLLGNDEGEPDGIRSSPLGILDSLELGIASLESALAELEQPLIRRQCLRVKLSIYVFIFSMDEEERKNSIDASNYVSKAYLTACEIIKNSVADQGNVRIWTALDCSHIIMGVMVLLFMSRQYPSPSNQVESRDCIQQAWSVLKMMARVEGDHFNRACDVIDWISNTDWTADLAVPEDTSKLLVRSRMDSNILFDIITRAKTRYLIGRNKRLQEQIPENRTQDAARRVARAKRPRTEVAKVDEIDTRDDGSQSQGTESGLSPFALLDQVTFPWDENAIGLFNDSMFV